ncbi:MAG: DeoR/GlpR transcriptional regulator [Eubacteriaceae bacterium]|jgi:DeoR/GlpR family transcriptional regulator of sugar metabolism|nr:DeoR/GlpR transcriptional regulator [Eubacteriaceae bacterium]
MYAEERREYILKKLQTDGKVSVLDLSDELQVSEVTIRRDLAVMDDMNLLTRTYGGAIERKSVTEQFSYIERETLNIDSKKHIAKKASTFLRERTSIFLDAGTTVRQLIPYVGELNSATVITFDIAMATDLARYPHITTVLVGGFLEHQTLSLVGIDTYKKIETLQADLSFIGCDAFNDTDAFSTSTMRAAIKAKLIENSDQSVLMCDSSKYRQKSLNTFAKLKDFNCFTTDRHNDRLNKFLSEQSLKNVIQ